MPRGNNRNKCITVLLRCSCAPHNQQSAQGAQLRRHQEHVLDQCSKPGPARQGTPTVISKQIVLQVHHPRSKVIVSLSLSKQIKDPVISQFDKLHCEFPICSVCPSASWHRPSSKVVERHEEFNCRAIIIHKVLQ